VGGDSTAPGHLLGVITDVLRDAEGATYLLDRQLCEVKVFDAEGTWRATLGRRGEAPGEFRHPGGLFWLPDGRLGIWQSTPARAVVLGRDGTAFDDLPLAPRGSFAMLRGVQRGGDRLLVEWMGMEVRDGRLRGVVRLEAWDPVDGGRSPRARQDLDLGALRGRPRLAPDARTAARVWACDEAGRLYLVNRHRGYRIEVHAPDGTLVRVLERDYAPVEVDPEAAAERQRAARLLRVDGLPPVDVVWPDTEPDILSLHPRAGGELWVRTSRSFDPDGGLGRFDVFDAAGRFVHVVRLELDFDAERDGWRLVGDRLYRLAHLRGSRAASLAGVGGLGDPDPDAKPLEVVAHVLPRLLAP
jgi:hypothetical protein